MENVKRGKGRPVGAVAKNTKQARAAIAQFVEGNIPKMNDWLNKVAYGTPKINRHGEIMHDADGCPIYITRPDFKGALDCLGSIIDYHLPRFSRQDVNITGTVANVDLIGQMSPQAQMLANMNPEQIASFLRGETAKVIEGETVEPLPEFLQQLEHDHE